jgi:hypothetical protein
MSNFNADARDAIRRSSRQPSNRGNRSMAVVVNLARDPLP